MRLSKNRIILTVLFVLFLILNGFLVIVHEPWRDEVHAWLITRQMSIPEMIVFSRQETHPILWNLVLFPFAKLGAPIWTMNLVSYLCIAVSAWLFVFKTKVHNIAKILILFTVPFVYTFSSIARNYCLVILLGMIICVLYGKRYEKPLIYSICISLLVFTHALAWGFVAGLTVTFHMKEIVMKIAGKSSLDKNRFGKVLAGFILIALSSVTVVMTLIGSGNKGLFTGDDQYTDRVIISTVVLMVLGLVLLLIGKGRIWKEFVPLCTTYIFMIVVYKLVYSGLYYQRLILIPAFMLFFTVTVFAENKDLKKLETAGIYVLFALSILVNGSLVQTFNSASDDILYNYSSAKEMADYINANLPDEDVILVDSGVYAQTIVPYTDKTLYDVRYEANITDSLYHVNDTDEIVAKLMEMSGHEEYKGKYIIMVYKFKETKLEKIYSTSDSVMGETYTLYRIPE